MSRLAILLPGAAAALVVTVVAIFVVALMRESVQAMFGRAVPGGQVHPPS